MAFTGTSHSRDKPRSQLHRANSTSEQSNLGRGHAALQTVEHVAPDAASHYLQLSPRGNRGSVFSDVPIFLQTCKNHVSSEIS